MKKLTSKKYRRLKRINWDYNIPVEDIFAVINGEKSHAGHWTPVIHSIEVGADPEII